MKTLTILTAGAILAVVTATGAIAQSSHSHTPMDAGVMQKMMQDMTPQPSDAPSTKAAKEAHMSMMKGMHIAFTGDADVDFVRGMIPHHQGAIDMAKVELQYGKDPVLRKLAETIIQDQEKEIAAMKEWLKKNGK